MSKKTVSVFGATGTAGAACVNEFINHDLYDVRVLARKPGQQERSSSGMTKSAEEKKAQYDEWTIKGVAIQEVDVSIAEELVPAFEGTDYVVSCVPIYATESQYPLIFAARDAGVERFVPSEFGGLYEFEQFSQLRTSHTMIARQKAFIRRVIELAGLDYTIIPAGAWPEYYMVEPVMVPGDPDEPLAWSTGTDVGRIIPHVLAHPASRNAICPVAATAYLSWNELLAAREEFLGREVQRVYMDRDQFQAAYDTTPPGPIKMLLDIGLVLSDSTAGMSLVAGNWNKTFLPEFKGMPLDELFRDRVEPFAEALKAELIATGQIPAE